MCKVRMWLGLIAMLVVGCQHQPREVQGKESAAVSAVTNTVDSKKAWLAIQHARAMIHDGDLVTRSDDDFESLTLQNFSNRDRAYSHAGIAFQEADTLVVYHSMTGVENPSGSVRRDPFDSFVNPVKKTGFGIFHYALTDLERQRLHKVLHTNHSTAMPFDVTFNLNSNDSMYCSEMIYKGLKEATKGRVVLPVSAIENFRPKILGYKYNRAFFKRFEYVGIDDLYLNPFCKEVIRVKY